MDNSVAALSAAINACYIGPEDLLQRSVSVPLTDSRSLYDPDASVFFALRTASGDGHNYIPQLYAAGVRVFVVDESYSGTRYADAAFLVVDDVMAVLRSYACGRRRRFTGQVVGITGSRGKTIVKEMLYAAMAPLANVVRSPRSFNSQTGVPLSAWEITDDTQVAIFEAGISRMGEMQTLADIIQPTVGIFTSLTGEHDDGFASPAGKAREKALLFASCHTVFYNGENRIIEQTLRAMYPDKCLIPAFGNDDMVRKAAAALLGMSETRNIEVPVPVNSRIDIADTDAGASIAFDHFTCDLSGIITGLDTVRRRTVRNRRLVAVLGEPLCNPEEMDAVNARLQHVLQLFGVTRVISENEMSSAVIPSDANVYINVTSKAAGRALYSSLTTRRNVTRLEINLDAVAANFRAYRSLLPKQTRLIGMIKAFGYGCGDIEVGRTLQDIGAAKVAVAVVDEGVALRRAGISIPIMVLDPWCENMRAIFANHLEPTIIDGSEDMLAMLEEYADAEGVSDINVHLKLDTGMHRVGLHEDDIMPFVECLKRHPRIHIASVFSHLATADCLDKDNYTNGQLALFRRMTDSLCNALGHSIPRHILNTAGITRYAKDHIYEFARLGIGLYGILPDPSLRDVTPPLTTVAKLVTRIIAVSEYPAGATVGYGCRGVLTRPSVIATIPVGYADGIDRHLGNGNAHFLVEGTMCPTVGNICMDLCMIDVTDAPLAAVGSEVQIFGPEAPIQRISDVLGTIPYEVIARISPRVQRLYFRE